MGQRQIALPRCIAGVGLRKSLRDGVPKVIAAVGNYGEIYDRNIGPKTPYSIERKGSLNAAWSDGGLVYSPPWY